MTHKAISDACNSLDLTVRQIPATGRKSFEAVAPGVRVYWSTSDLGLLLGLPRITTRRADTYLLSIKEIKYLVKEVYP